MSQEIKVSVIVPVYNAKEHIRRCLDTLVNQSLKEIEIICVLDKPSDGTDSVVLEYANSDNRIVVLKNDASMHVSKCRNRGLSIAQGEYIGFSDHDDWRCDMKMYEDLYEKARQDDSDVVVSNTIISYQGNKNDEVWRFRSVNKQDLIRANILPMLGYINPQMITHCVWHSIFKKEYLEKNGIVFKDREDYLDEDRLFNFEAYLNAGKISFVDKSYYVWEQYMTSVSHTHSYNYALRQITRTQWYVDYLKDRKLFDDYKKDIWKLIALELKVYLSDYQELGRKDWLRLGLLMKDVDYPLIVGGGYDLRFLSKKRFKVTMLCVYARVLALFNYRLSL